MSLPVWQFAGIDVPLKTMDIPELTPGAEITFVGVWPGGYTDDSGTTAADLYESVREYGTVAGHYAGELTIDNNPWFRERIPSSRPVDHCVVEITPPSAAVKTPAFWAAIDDYSDESQLDTKSDGLYSIEVSLTYLGTVADYPTRTDLEAAFSDDITPPGGA